MIPPAISPHARESPHGARSPQQSFYHLADGDVTGRRCEGTACFVARNAQHGGHAFGESDDSPLYCLGRCHAAPARAGDRGGPSAAMDAPGGRLLTRIVAGGARTLDDSRAQGGYLGLEAACRMGSEKLIAEIETSELRGRGGAGFPTGTKWRLVASQPGRPKYVVANADEGDPGAYIDRYLMEDDPHCLIEGMILAGYAVGAQLGVIYLRKEYPDAHVALTNALAEARAAGLLGPAVAGSGFAFDVEIFVGQGSYVCGEETALLNSLAGEPPLVRLRPPYPSERGLFGKPTLVNNVETLANIPWIARYGGDAYRALGVAGSRGTKVVSLNSLFRRPGLYEVEFGVPVRHIIEDLGGGLRTGNIRGVIIGGPLAGVLPPHLFDTPFDFESLQRVGCCVGHGGIVAFDEHTSIPQLLHHVFRFAAEESCGKCTPCRAGARTVQRLLERSLRPSAGRSGDLEYAADIIAALRSTSLCGLGTGLADFALSVQRHYPEELAGAFNHV